MANRMLYCYAEGRDGDWEAICLDLDVAVQGHSFAHISTSLREAIALYLETIADLQSDEQRALLRPSAPLAVRLSSWPMPYKDFLAPATVASSDATLQCV
jgi:predicted RNase H-like HicB family nuclease